MAGPVTKTFAGVGLLLLLAMAGNTALVTLPNKIRQYRETLDKPRFHASGERALLASEEPSP